jgi:hypothetical protein
MAAREIPVPHDPTDEEALALFQTVEEKFPSKTLGDDKWYVLVVWLHSCYVLKLSTK